MIILALDAALDRISAAIAADGEILASAQAPGGRGQAAILPPMVAALLEQTGLRAGGLDGVAVTVGPGSFTGLRAAIALAQGIGLTGGIPVVGVTVAEALAVHAPPGRMLWVALDGRRGRVLLDRGGGMQVMPLDGLPMPTGPVAVAGNAAIAVFARLAAAGADALLSDARQPDAASVALVGALRLRGEIVACPAQPIYLEAAAVTHPAARLRPAPA